MKEIKLKNNGEMTERDQSYFGGKHGLLDRFKMGGIGSSKVIYLSGVPHFDSLNSDLENEISFANFEIMKDGFIIRLRKNLRQKYIGFKPNEITAINLKKVPLPQDTPRDGFFNKSIPHEGLLEITTDQDKTMVFKVAAIDLKNIQSFFQKDVFKDLLRIE